VNLKVEDYFQIGKRSLIRFREKGGKEAEIPVHHKLEELLDQYLETSGLRNLGIIRKTDTSGPHSLRTSPPSLKGTDNIRSGPH
jgi:hypothetical protein